MVSMARIFSSTKFWIGVIALLFLGMLYWMSSYITWKEEEIDLGYSKEARKDDFLAVKQFLQQQGVASESLRSFAMLDQMEWQGERLGPDDTLILLNAHKMLRGQRLDNVLAWVEQGGTVITSTYNPFIGNNTGTRDPLLDHFGIEVDHYDDDEDPETESVETYDDDIADELDEELKEDLDKALDSFDEEENPTQDAEDDSTDEDGEQDNGHENKQENEDNEKNRPENYYRCSLFQEPMAVDFLNESEPLLIDYSEGDSFDFYGDEPQGWSGDEVGLHLAQFDWGQGLVIINSDNTIWENQRVDCHDHAYALWKLINHNGKVWFLINQEAPSLWTILWRATPYGMLAALLALALWLWAKATRFGPILTRATPGRRSLAEHIHASAMLLWRRQQHPYLVSLLRQELRQHLQQHYPLFNQWSEQEQIAHLQTLTPLSAGDLHKALFSDKLQHPQDFTLAVACLQTIRKSV
jgi:hypothetical protein